MIFGKRRIGIIIFIIMLISSVAFYTTSQVTAQESGVPSLAPVNPDFLKYIQDLKIGRFQSVTGDGHALGYIPPPVDLSHLKGLQVYQSFGVPKVSSPSAFDLRTLGKLTPVKDQGNCGSCWAFATYGSLESNLLPGETWDFSENNLKNTHGFDPGLALGAMLGCQWRILHVGVALSKKKMILITLTLMFLRLDWNQ